jgi:hypothetical protein
MGCDQENGYLKVQDQLLPGTPIKIAKVLCSGFAFAKWKGGDLIKTNALKCSPSAYI